LPPVSDEPETRPAEFPDPREAWSSPYRGIEFELSAKWLAGGALLYAMLLLVFMAGNPREATWPIVGPSLYLTPMFGLPYVLATVNRPGRTRRLLFFIGLLPLVHIGANYAAWYYATLTFDLAEPGLDQRHNLIAGGIGGLLGSAAAFALLHLVRLTAPRRQHLIAMIAGVILLTALGAAAMAAGLQWTDALRRTADGGRQVIWYETVHFPWQLLFALLLAWLMRKPREPRRRPRELPAEPVEVAQPFRSISAE
jgi:hypothetical protein